MTHSPQEKIDMGVFSFLASQIRKQAWRANFPEIVHATNYENTFITDPENMSPYVWKCTPVTLTALSVSPKTER